MAKYRFKLLRGRHVETKDKDGQDVILRRGDVFESDRELDRMFNSRNSQKFLRVDQHNQPSPHSLQEAASEQPTATTVVDPPQEQSHDSNQSLLDEWELTGKTIAQLRQFAEDYEIDVPATATKKEEILNVISNALEARA